MGSLVPPSADGIAARWHTWDGEHVEAFSLRWENEGWTATGEVGRERIQYALRLSPFWEVRQFLLFRDVDEPDLWLAADARGRWGEVNGAHRPDLSGCADVHLDCTPFSHTVPIRRLDTPIGDIIEVRSIAVDVETLSAVPAVHRYERLGERRWRFDDGRTGAVEFDVDEHGLALDVPDRFRRSDV